LVSDDVRYKLMRLLEANPQMSQRDVARALGISIGKVNYSLRALVRRAHGTSTGVLRVGDLEVDTRGRTVRRAVHAAANQAAAGQ